MALEQAKERRARYTKEKLKIKRKRKKGCKRVNRGVWVWSDVMVSPFQVHGLHKSDENIKQAGLLLTGDRR
jgi:hypothetical protein